MEMETKTIKQPTPEEIRARRLAAGLTQTQAAHIIYAPSYKTWQPYENGRAKIPLAAWVLFLIETDNLLKNNGK